MSGSLGASKCCISYGFGASRFENVIFLLLLEPRDFEMLYFLSFWSLELIICCISISFGALRFGNVAFLLVLECDAMEVFEKYLNSSIFFQQTCSVTPTAIFKKHCSYCIF